MPRALKKRISTITPEQKEKLNGWLQQSNPALSYKAIKRMVERDFGVPVSVASIGRIWKHQQHAKAQGFGVDEGLRTRCEAKLANILPEQKQKLHAWIEESYQDKGYEAVRERISREFGITVSAATICKYWRTHVGRTRSIEKRKRLRTRPDAKLENLPLEQKQKLHAWIEESYQDKGYEAVRERISREFGITVSAATICEYWRTHVGRTRSIEKRKRLRTRPDAKLENLPLEQKQQIRAWLTQGGPHSSYKAVRLKIKQEFGITVSVAPIQKFWLKYCSRRGLSKNCAP